MDPTSFRLHRAGGKAETGGESCQPAITFGLFSVGYTVVLFASFKNAVFLHDVITRNRRCGFLVLCQYVYILLSYIKQTAQSNNVVIFLKT